MRQEQIATNTLARDELHGTKGIYAMARVRLQARARAFELRTGHQPKLRKDWGEVRAVMDAVTSP